MQLEKALRNKKSLEAELEKVKVFFFFKFIFLFWCFNHFIFYIQVNNENIRAANRENSSYDDLHRRYCTVEREKDEVSSKLENKETELKQLQKL